MLDLSQTPLRPSPLLDELSPKVRNCLLTRSRKQVFARGQTISLEGGACHSLKIILDGWVKLYRVTPSGHEALLAALGSGQSFDEVAALQGLPNAANAEAVTECDILFVDISTMCACHNARRQLAAAVLSAASSHLQMMMDDLGELKVLTGYQRLCSFLLRLSDRNGAQSSLDLPFDKVVLASMLGMKPESLSRAFGKLRKIGVESEYKSVTIRDFGRLRDAVQ